MEQQSRSFNFVSFCGSVLLSALLIFGFATNASAQQAKYWIDHNLDSCRQNDEPGSHTVLAYSPAQFTWCAWKFTSLEEARDRALRECKADVPRTMRQIAPCKIIWEDGRILDKSAFREERRDHSIPMSFEVYDGVTGTKDIKKGLLIGGKFRSWDARPLIVRFVPGSVVCKGSYAIRAPIRVDAKMTCFDDIVFTGKKFRRGGYFKDGGRFVPFFEATFRHQDSYIKFELLRN